MFLLFWSIEKRRDELRKAHAEYIKNMPDPEQPPGHRKLPDEERLKTLKTLEESMNWKKKIISIKFVFIIYLFLIRDWLAHKKMLSELNSLPIRDDTFRIRQTKAEYEKRLAEIEEAIKIFSKPKVFVKIDS